MHSLRLDCAIATLASCGCLASAPIARAQAPGSPPVAGASAATLAADSQSEDRIFALVQAGKCAQAKAAAERSGDTSLAEQIGTMCGAKASASPSGGESGRRRGADGGGQGGISSGRRGGS